MAAVFMIFGSVTLQAQSEYAFTEKVEISAGPVQNQSRTGTCWSFATISFLESELIRLGKGEHRLSEMYMVRYVYPEKATEYVRRHGNSNFGQGSLSHDVMKVIANHGMVPEEVYRGLKYGSEIHNHGELYAGLKGFTDGVLARRSGLLTDVWIDAYSAILDVYLGTPPATFNYRGRTYTPKQFASEMGIVAEDYVELTSYNHHPYYTQFVLEVPDNWANSLYYNLPLDELMQVMDFALANGHTIAWDGDVSERTFSHREGLAVLPAKSWEDMTEDERRDVFRNPVEELVVNQENRQHTFNNFSTTDDHLMHINGTARDQNGTLYYLTKNSYGTENNPMGGYLYMSEPYVRMKTIAIMVHKDAIPADIKQKLGI